jgi:hypothetical protein
MRAGIAAVVIAAIALVAALAASASTPTYSLTTAKKCLEFLGVSFQQPIPSAATAGLTSAQKADVLAGPVSGLKAPAFLYLVIASSGAEADAILKSLSKTAAPAPTKSNSLSGEQGNAAWMVISANGGQPSIVAKVEVLSCLVGAAVPTYTVSSVSHCLIGRSQRPAIMGLLQPMAKAVFRRKVPASLVPHVLIALSQPGIGFIILFAFGDNTQDAVTKRDALAHALQLPSPSYWSGAKENVAWDAVKLRGATPKALAAGRAAVLACLP